jgi:hypothetical protein
VTTGERMAHAPAPIWCASVFLSTHWQASNPARADLTRGGRRSGRLAGLTKTQQPQPAQPKKLSSV